MTHKVKVFASKLVQMLNFLAVRLGVTKGLLVRDERLALRQRVLTPLHVVGFLLQTKVLMGPLTL